MLMMRDGNRKGRRMRAEKIKKTNAMRELDRAGVSYEVHAYEDDGEEASGLGVQIAERLGEDPDQSFKTLVTQTPSGGHVVCCIPVAEELDLKAAARAAGEKSLSMMHVRDLFAVTGYVRGGCTPIGMKTRFPVLLDETCVLWDSINISGGRRGLSLTVPTDGLIAVTGATVAPICR